MKFSWILDTVKDTAKSKVDEIVDKSKSMLDQLEEQQSVMLSDSSTKVVDLHLEVKHDQKG